MQVPCELARIVISEGHDGQIIYLREKDGKRAFPIVIGIYEAYAIHRKVSGESTPRPLTHDLLTSVIGEMGGKLERIVVTDLKNETFFAELHIRQGDRVVQIDARPSDSIALAVQLDADIYVEDAVLDQVAHHHMPDAQTQDDQTPEDAAEDDDNNINLEDLFGS